MGIFPKIRLDVIRLNWELTFCPKSGTLKTPKKGESKMTQKEIDKILADVRALDPALQYLIFYQYIREETSDLEFLKAEIECQISKRSTEDE